MDVRRGQYQTHLCVCSKSLDLCGRLRTVYASPAGLPEPGMSGGGAFTEDGVFLGSCAARMKKEKWLWFLTVSLRASGQDLTIREI